MIVTDIPEMRILERMRAEYDESPGLSLTARQAQRLWGLDAERCSLLLEELVHEHFLRRTPTDMYVRVNFDR